MRISVHTDKQYTVDECNAKCLATTGCVEFEHGPTLSNRCDLYNARDCTWNPAFAFNVYKPVPITSKNSVSQQIKINVYDCGSKTVSLVDASKPQLEYTKDSNLNIITLKTSDQAKALFQTEDATCPILNYEIISSSTSLPLPSSDDVYKVLGMSTRSSDEIKFNTGFTPANNIKKRTVEFKMNAYNYVPKKL